MNSGKLNATYGVIVLLLVLILLVIVMSAGATHKNSVPMFGAVSVATAGSEFHEVSPAVRSRATIDALGGDPTPNADQLRQIQEAQLYRSLYERPGIIIAQGTNTTPTNRSIWTYRIEEVTLPGPTTFSITQDKSVTVSKYWRLIVDGQFDVGTSLGYGVWVDDKFLGGGAYPAIAGKEDGLVVIVFDRSLLREGATIGVSYGDDSRSRIDVPEKIHFGSGH